MSHLDAHLKFQMMIELRRIHQSLERTMLFVTHDQMEALALSDTIAVMRAGNIEQVGPPEQLYRKPKTAFVAKFLGGSNYRFSAERLGASAAKRKRGIPIGQADAL